MTERILYYLFLLSGIVPASLSVFGVIALFPNLLLSFDFSVRWFVIFTSFVLAIAGYVGLVMLLKMKSERLRRRIILLCCGIAGTILFISVNDGVQTWKWIFSMNDPSVFYIFIWPMIVAASFIFKILYDMNVRNFPFR